MDTPTQRLALFTQAMTWFADDNTPTSTDTETAERDTEERD